MRLKKLLCIVLAVLCMFAVTACNGEETPTTGSTGTTDTSGTTDTTETTETTETTATTSTTEQNKNPEDDSLEKQKYNVLENLNKIKVYGRGTQADGGITADWSAAGIEFNAYCEGSIQISAKISGSLVVFAVYVDGVLQDSPAIFSSGESNKRIVTGLERGEHNIRLVRKTMVENGNVGQLCAIKAITVYGELRDRPADKGLLIEFVGDSITCGYGIHGSDASIAPDGSCTYAVKVADALNADVSTISVSGIGVYRGTSRHNERGLNMANAYDINSWYRSQTVEYKPTRQADIVVVNLNTNDNAQVKNLIDDELATAKAEYKAAAKLMIEKIRAINGEDVKILWVCGMMSNGNDPINVQADAWIAELFEEMGGEAKGLYLLTGLIRNTSGAAGHPVELYHGFNAEKIAQFIQENILK